MYSQFFMQQHTHNATDKQHNRQTAQPINSTTDKQHISATAKAKGNY